jgi:hypothetical protein
MDAWWWVAIGLLGWFSVSLAAGLFLGRFLGRSSQARDALDARENGTLANRQDPPGDGPSLA